MDLGAPINIVAPTVRGALLQALVRFERPVTRRELARAADVSQGGANPVIQELIEGGLVDETVAGRSSLVALNRDHLAAEPIIALAATRSRLLDRLRERVTEWSDCRAAWVFGSVARGDAGPHSDIDLLLILDDPTSESVHHRIAALHTDAQRWTGNELQIVEHTSESWAALVADGNPLVVEVSRDGIQLLAHEVVG